MSFLIEATNEEGERIETNFVVVVDDVVILESKTNINSYEEIKIPIEHSILQIFNYNDEHYTKHTVIFVGNQKSFDLGPLHKFGEVFIDYEEGLNENGGCKNITFYTNDWYQGTGYAIRWSSNILEVKDLNSPVGINLVNKELCELYGYNWINETIDCGFWCKKGIGKQNITYAHCEAEFYGVSIPQRLKNKVDKIYYPRKTINSNTNLTVQICYTTINPLTEDDYIRIYAFDSGRSLKNREIIENIDGKDVGGKDWEFVINK